MDAVRSIRSLAWKPLKMAIRIQDFGMLHVAPDLSGVIPLNAFEAQAASVRDLAAGVMDVSGVAGTALKEMQEVRDAGQWAQARDGMYRFEQDVMAGAGSRRGFGTPSGEMEEGAVRTASFLSACPYVRPGEGARGHGERESGDCREHLFAEDVPSGAVGGGAPVLGRGGGVCRGAGRGRSGRTQD